MESIDGLVMDEREGRRRERPQGHINHCESSETKDGSLLRIA